MSARRMWSSRGDMVEVVVLGVNGADKRIALGLKQARGVIPGKMP